MPKQMDADLKKIRASAGRLVALIDNPQPGLMSWLRMLIDAMKETHNVLGEVIERKP